MQRVVVLILCFLFLTSNNKQKLHANIINQETQIVLTNIAFGAIIATIGSIINHANDEHWYKTIPKALWQGALGGVVTYLGKKTAYLIRKEENLLYAWPARFIHAAGQSMIENVALNKNFWESYKLDLYFTRLEYNFSSNVFKARLAPFALGGMIYMANYGKLNLEKSLLGATVVFEGKFSKLRENFPSTYFHRYKSIMMWDEAVPNVYSYFFSHELIHSLQYTDFMSFNALLNKPINKISNQFGLMKTILEYVYLDVHYMHLVYQIQHLQVNSDEQYYRNYFEFEAERLSSGSDVEKY